jgi:hypothetical protein
VATFEVSLSHSNGLLSFNNTRLPLPTGLDLDGERLNPLSVEDLQYFETRFFLVQGPRSARNPRR